MGKKTVRVPFTSEISKTSMFCQSKARLLELYKSEELLNGMIGCVIHPLNQSDGKYFFYRKDLKNGDMLVTGECYPVYTETDYQEGVYYLDEDYAPNTVTFIEEDSLTDDDEYADKELNAHVKDKKLQQELQKLEVSATANEKPVNDPLVYIVDVLKNNTIGRSSSDEDFIAEAKKQAMVYTLKEFEESLNYDELNTENCFFRIRNQ